ncbi:G-protein coupled receptor 61-like [Glandiceps talaboti]
MNEFIGNHDNPNPGDGDGNSTNADREMTAAIIVQVVFMVLIDIFAVCGNVSVMFVVIRNPQLRSFAHLFVLNLCIIDLLAASLVLPVAITTVALEEWIFGETFCRASGFLNAFCIFASISTLAIISVERYYSIAKPMVYAAKVTLQRVLITIVYIWLQSAAFAMAPLVGLNEFTFNPHRAHCSYDWSKPGYHIYYIVMIGLLCFALPACLIIGMYCGIFCVARKTARQVGPTPAVSIEQAEATTSQQQQQQHGSNSNHDMSSKCPTTVANKPISKTKSPICGTEFKAVKTLSLIIGIFLVLWTPYFAVLLYGIIHGQIVSQDIWERVTTWFAYTSFTLNPYIYGWLNRQLRQELIRTLKNCNQCKKDEDNEMEDFPGDGEDFYQFLERTSTRTTSLNTKSSTTTTTTTTVTGKDQSVGLPHSIIEIPEAESD